MSGAAAAGRRTTLALLAGALAGLGMAASQLFQAPGAFGGQPDAHTLALVNGRPVLRSDFIAQLKTLTGKPVADTRPEERRQVLDDMVREELFVQRGLEMEFAATDAEVRAALVRAVEQQVTADVNFAAPDEAELRRFHEQHAERFRTRGTLGLRAYVRPAPADDAALRNATREASRLASSTAAADMPRALLAAGWQEAPQYASEPDLYVALERRLGRDVFEEVRLLPEGAWSQPLHIGTQLLLVGVTHHRPPRPQRFEEARDEVLRASLAERSAARLAETAAFLRGRADIRWNARLEDLR